MDGRGFHAFGEFDWQGFVQPRHQYGLNKES